MLLSFLVAVCVGFLVGILVNLIADYAPARRLHFEAKRSPFASRDSVPPLPRFFPQAPIYAWSGWGAWLTRRGAFSANRWRRRLTVELIMPLFYVWLVASYADQLRLPTLLIYAPLLLLVVIIDIEYRWILNSILLALVSVVLLEIILFPNDLFVVLRAGLYGFGIMFLLYLLGIVFGQGVGVLRGRGVGRTVLGFGDVKLVAVGGLMVGWPGIGFALIIMVFTGAIGALSVLFNQKRRRGRLRVFSAIPYAPYIVLGIAVQLYLPWVVGAAFVRFVR